MFLKLFTDGSKPVLRCRACHCPTTSFAKYGKSLNNRRPTRCASDCKVEIPIKVRKSLLNFCARSETAGDRDRCLSATRNPAAHGPGRSIDGARFFRVRTDARP